MELKKEKFVINVETCSKDCPFFTKMDEYPMHIYCNHPKFNGKSKFFKLIINNIDKNFIPVKCPLKENEVIIKIKDHE